MAQMFIVFLSSIFKMFISTWSQMFKMIVFDCLNFVAKGTSLLSASITLTKIEVSFVKNKIHSMGSLSIQLNIKGLNRVLKA